MLFRKILFFVYSFSLSLVVLTSCNSNDNTKPKTNVKEKSTALPSFTIGLKELITPAGMPLVQSGAWAVQGNKLLLVGGRIQGFHGIEMNDTIFNRRYANKSIWVINLSDFSYSELKLDDRDKRVLPLMASSVEFLQDDDSLYIVGGYGTKDRSAIQSNYTFNTLYAISVSAMINAVETNGNPLQAVFLAGSAPELQVTGGGLLKSQGTFYLMFGQNFPRVYNPGVTGKYTEAIRSFNLNGQAIAVVNTCTDSLLHRRDLNVAPITQQSGVFFAGFGGVFTNKDNGYLQPVYYFPNQGTCKIVQDTLRQLTNQYNCAQASVYDPASNTNITVLMGGIGQYQYNEQTGQWENGDHGAKLPFVKSITQMIFSNNQMQQKIQIPPAEPEMPGFIGANAIFIPDSTLLYNQEVIDYTKITADTTVIGLLYGGIKSSRPTSSMDYPTSVNNTIYQVVLYKQSPAAKNN